LDRDSVQLVNPAEWWRWDWSSSTTPTVPSVLDGGFIHSWQNTDAVMLQPPLDHHLIVLHEGGAKRVSREGAGGRKTAEVSARSITTIEVGSSYRWTTEGPVGFSHYYVAPDYFANLVATTFDRDPSKVSFAETIGRADPYSANIFELILSSRDDPNWSAIAQHYADALLVRLAATSHWDGEFVRFRRVMLAPHVVRRVRDFIRANLEQRITLDDMAAVAGYSRFHFGRAFKQTTGMPPYAYVHQERLACARDLLEQTSLPIAQIARQCGFGSHAYFSVRFRDATGLTPAEYRRARERGGDTRSRES
jgi:AraC family transcriptional regulator